MTGKRLHSLIRMLTPHSTVCRSIFYLSCSLWFRHAQLDCLALVLFCKPYDQGHVRNMSAQPDRIIRFRTSVFWFPYNSSQQWYFGGKVSEKLFRLSRAYNKYQNQIAQIIRLEFLFYFICTCVYAYTNQTLQTCRLSRVFIANHKV